MDPLTRISPATHSIVYRREFQTAEYLNAPRASVLWHIAIMDDGGQMETSKDNLLWEHAEHYMLRWHEQFGLPIFQIGETPDQVTEGL